MKRICNKRAFVTALVTTVLAAACFAAAFVQRQLRFALGGLLLLVWSASAFYSAFHKETLDGFAQIKPGPKRVRALFCSRKNECYRYAFSILIPAAVFWHRRSYRACLQMLKTKVLCAQSAQYRKKKRRTKRLAATWCG